MCKFNFKRIVLKFHLPSGKSCPKNLRQTHRRVDSEYFNRKERFFPRKAGMKMENLKNLRVGFGVCGSFCTFKKAFSAAKKLKDYGCEVVPFMSFNAASIDSRFGAAKENIAALEEICQNKVVATIEGAEPVGPKKLLDVMCVAPCTSNTAAKLALGITDTPVTMAVKSHVRNSRPVVIAISTNDALAASAKNIGVLQNYRNFYFVPYSQDDCDGKPFSMVAHFELLPHTISKAVEGVQFQPMILY